MVFELFARVSKTTVSPSRSLISRVNQCLRPYVSILSAAERTREIHPYKVSVPRCLRAIPPEKHVPFVRSGLIRSSLTI